MPPLTNGLTYPIFLQFTWQTLAAYSIWAMYLETRLACWRWLTFAVLCLSAASGFALLAPAFEAPVLPEAPQMLHFATSALLLASACSAVKKNFRPLLLATCAAVTLVPGIFLAEGAEAFGRSALLIFGPAAASFCGLGLLAAARRPEMAVYPRPFRVLPAVFVLLRALPEALPLDMGAGWQFAGAAADAALALALCYGLIYLTHARKKSLHLRPIFFQGTAATLAVCAATFFLSGHFSAVTRKGHADSLLAQARTAAAVLAPADISRLAALPAHMPAPVRERLAWQLRRIRETSPDIRFVYIAARPQDTPMLLVDAEPANSPAYAPPGTLYPEAPAELRQSLAHGTATVSAPYTDRWGEWISAFLPLRSPGATGPMALGMDISAPLFSRTLYRSAVAGYAIGYLAFLLVVAVSVIRRRYAEVSRAYALLADSEEKYRTLVEHANDGIAILQGKTCLYMNPRLIEILGLPAHTENYENLLDLLLPKDRAKVDNYHARRIADDPTLPASYDISLTRPDGGIRHMEISPARFTYRSRPAVMVIARDISKIQRARRELEKARDETRAASRTKKAFLANMSHEFRTPMNAVLGMTDLLLDTELTDEQRMYAATLRDSGKALLKLINDMLELTKMDSEILPLKNEDFMLSDLLRDVCTEISPKAREKRLELVCESRASGSRFHGDFRRLRQVLVYLLDNAVKFTEQGEVLVSVEDEGPDRLRFRVADTGIGLDEEQLETVFRDFYQADSSFTRRHGGAGLGLALSRRLVELMDGRIRAKNVPGGGAEFSFAIPLKRLKAPAAPGKPQFLSGHRILLVDDNSTARGVLAAGLAACGAAVAEASGTPEALRLAAHAENRGAPFALAFIDAELEGGDGFGLAGEMRAMLGDSAPKMVLLSPAASDSPPAGKKGPGEKIIAKPVLAEDAARTAMRILGGSERP